MIIAIDFDGTIAADSYPVIGELMPGAAKVINALKQAGHYLILNTCRNGADLVAALDFCAQHGISFDRVNDNHPEKTAQHYPTRKVYADVYIDDRNLFGFPGWNKVAAELLVHEQPSCNDLERRVKQAFGMTLETICTRTRKREIVEKRRICMWYLRKIKKLEPDYIAETMGGFHRTTVPSACKSVEGLMQVDKAYRQKVENFLNAL